MSLAPLYKAYYKSSPKSVACREDIFQDENLARRYLIGLTGRYQVRQLYKSTTVNRDMGMRVWHLIQEIN